MQSLRKTLLSYFSSLSAGKKIGLLALLVILLALPLSLTALRQRQEIRKKAEQLPGPAAPEVVFGKVVVRFRGPVRNQGYRARFEEEDGTIDQLSLLKQHLGVTEEKPLQLEQKPARVDPGGLRVQSEEEAKQTKNDTIEVLTYSADANPFGVARQFENLPQVVWAEPVFVYHATQEATEAGSQPTGTEPQIAPLGGETASPTPIPTSSPNPTVCNYPSPPDDPYYCSGDQWSLQKIRAYDAWQVTTGSDSIIVAVVDSGVDLNHQDLAANLLPGKNFVDGSNNPQDDNGHGTHVAGIIGGVGNNSIGISGINWRVKILPVKVADSHGGAHTVAIAEGISWAVAHGARVINLSLGGQDESQLMTEVVNDAYLRGVTVVAAAGNSSSPAEDFFPASTPHVVTVTATGPGDESSSYTNYGSTVEVSAPGGNRNDSSGCQNTTCILSTFPQGRYKALQGTSMAAPHVAGLAALSLAKQPNLTPDQVEAVLENSADDLAEPGWDPYFGWGRINAEKALTQTDTTPLPLARLQVGEASQRTVGFSATVRGTYRIDQAPTRDGPWSNEGIVLTDPQPGTDGEVITGSYTPPDGYKGTRFLRVTAESQSGKIRYTLGESYIDPTLPTISLPFYNSFNMNVADVDGDGQEDIVLANQDRIAVANQEGSLLPGWPQAFRLSRRARPFVVTAVGELDKNYPGKEVVAVADDKPDYHGIPDIPDYRGFKLMAWHADGTAVDGWPTSTFRRLGGYREHIVVLADLDKDGADEVIFTDYSPVTKLSTLYVLSGNGRWLGGFPPHPLPGMAMVRPLVADLDGDGQLEIALLYRTVSTRVAFLWAVSARGVVLPNLPKWLYHGTYDLLAATGDINGDGKDEIVVFKNNIWAGSSTILIVAGTGQILQKRVINTTPLNLINFSATLSIADLAGDGKARIILSVESRIHILNERGEDTQNPLGLSDIASVFTTLAKRDNNGDSELIVTGYNNAGDYILKRFKSSGGPFTEESTVKFPHDYAFAFGTQNPSGILLSGVGDRTRQNSVLGIGTGPGVWMWQQTFGDPKLASYYANTNRVRSYSLLKGWNLFGLELNPEQKLAARDLAEKLKSIAGSNVAIIGFDPGKGQALAHFTNPEKAILNNLEEITLGQGYWVRVEKDAQFELTGTRPVLPQQVAFKTGWQLVSFPYLPDGYDAPSFANKLKELTGGNTIIIGFDPGKGQALAHFTNPEKAILNNLDKLEHKRGYWLRVEADITIKVNSDGTVEKFEQ